MAASRRKLHNIGELIRSASTPSSKCVTTIFRFAARMRTEKARPIRLFAVALPAASQFAVSRTPVSHSRSSLIILAIEEAMAGDESSVRKCLP
jgi:hypothetical protein